MRQTLAAHLWFLRVLSVPSEHQTEPETGIFRKPNAPGSADAYYFQDVHHLSTNVLMMILTEWKLNYKYQLNGSSGR